MGKFVYQVQMSNIQLYQRPFVGLSEGGDEGN